jgi:hypothetical protein
VGSSNRKGEGGRVGRRGPTPGARSPAPLSRRLVAPSPGTLPWFHGPASMCHGPVTRGGGGLGAPGGGRRRLEPAPSYPPSPSLPLLLLTFILLNTCYSLLSIVNCCYNLLYYKELVNSYLLVSASAC